MIRMEPGLHVPFSVVIAHHQRKTVEKETKKIIKMKIEKRNLNKGKTIRNKTKKKEKRLLVRTVMRKKIKIFREDD